MTATLLTAWDTSVRADPSALAIADAATGIRVSREELDAQAEKWRDTHGTGVAGRTVVLAEENGPNWVRVFLGLLKSDAIILPLDPGEPMAAQMATATATRSSWLWSGGELRPVMTDRPRVRDGRRIVKLTSGSTGEPRALPFTDAQMLADGGQVCRGMDIRPDDVNFGLIPLGHSYGLGNLVMPLLAQGTAIVSGAAPFPHAMADTIAQWRPTVFPAVPALLRALAISDVPPAQLAPLRVVISAGAPLAPDIAQAFASRFERKIHSFYGSTETGGITYDQSGDAASTGRSVGRPLPGVRIEFGMGGRFAVESAAVYTLGNRRRGASGFGVHRPADIGAMTPEGELVLLGRAGRFVKIAGRRLNLVEIEQALKRVPGVRDALVVAHAERADALAAIAATDQPADAIRTALRERLAAWKIPKKLVTMAAFPLTARGKTDTAELRRILGPDIGSGS
jgi:acyl-coenzyme A synthetase/AMP-(fatty) acid ligase